MVYLKSRHHTYEKHSKSNFSTILLFTFLLKIKVLITKCNQISIWSHTFKTTKLFKHNFNDYLSITVPIREGDNVFVFTGNSHDRAMRRPSKASLDVWKSKLNSNCMWLLLKLHDADANLMELPLTVCVETTEKSPNHRKITNFQMLFSQNFSIIPLRYIGKSGSK